MGALQTSTLAYHVVFSASSPRLHAGTAPKGLHCLAHTHKSQRTHHTHQPVPLETASLFCSVLENSLSPCWNRSNRDRAAGGATFEQKARGAARGREVAAGVFPSDTNNFDRSSLYVRPSRSYQFPETRTRHPWAHWTHTGTVNLSPIRALLQNKANSSTARCATLWQRCLALWWSQWRSICQLRTCCGGPMWRPQSHKWVRETAVRLRCGYTRPHSGSKR